MQGCHLGIEEEKWLERVGQGRGRCAGMRWGRVAGEQEEDEELEHKE